MSWLSRLLPVRQVTTRERIEPRASGMYPDGGLTITTSAELEAALRGQSVSDSGMVVNPDTAMRIGAVYACVRLISGAVATMPLKVMKRIDAKHREEASAHPLWTVLRRRPNRWQTPSQFRRMMTAHVVLRGNAYAYIVWSMGRVIEVIPLHPDRVTVRQLADGSLEYRFVGPNGTVRVFDQADILHLYGLSLDGFRGVSPITYARETIGAAMAMEQYGANLFRNGTQVGSAFTLPKGASLSEPQFARLKAQLDEFKQHGSRAGGTLLLEDGMEVDKLGMSSIDAQWIEAMKMSRSGVAMFLGVPPSMIGDNTGSDSNWGTGLEQKTQGFVTFGLEDYLTMWEEGCERSLLREQETDIYVQFTRAALVRGDLKSRTDHNVKMLQWGVYNPDEVRASDDLNPREDGNGGRYYDPPNTAGEPAKGDGDDVDPQTAKH